jgi:site-specific recombinase XerD
MLYEEKIMNENLSSFVELPKLRRSLPRQVPNEKEMNEFLNAISGKDPKSLRDRALYELLYATGLRSAEVRSLTLEDVDFSQKTLFVRGKGDKDRIVPIGQWVIPYLIEYLEQGRRRLLREPTNLLFITRRGAKLDENDLIYSIRKYSKGLTLTNHISPHGFRHACATHLLRGGADIRYIQELLGHSELSSTQVYTRIEITALKEAHGRFHPRERMLYGE